MVHRSAGSLRARRITFLAALALAGAFGLLVAASAIEHAVYAGRVLPGVHVDGVTVAGKKDATARDEIARLAAHLDTTPLRAVAGATHFSAPPALIDFDVNVDATVDAVRSDGRSNNPLALVTGTLIRRMRPDRVPIVVHYDDARLEGLLDGWSNSVAHGLVEGGLRFVGTTVMPISPKNGVGLIRDEARRQILRALSSPDRVREIRLPVGTVQPHTDQGDVDRAAAKARALLAAGVEIDAGANRLVLAPAQIAAMLGTRVSGNALDLTLDPNKLRFALGSVVNGYEQPPVDATFAVSSDSTVSVVPSQDGHVVDFDAAARDILAGKRVVVLERRLMHPKRDTAWAKKLGITEQVSSFTTYYPAGQPRVHNIQLAADTLNDTVVEPNEVFSLNGVLGPRTPEKGYVKAPILVEEGFGEDYGGGISQLATTLYNAIFFGGYTDVEHSPHAFYISRYPMGREATVVYPSVDVRFRDDTSHGVLIRASYGATSVTVTFFGDNEGRVVREENRKLLKTVPITDTNETCPVSNPKDDPNDSCGVLDPGERVLAQSGETGYDVEFDRVIEQPGRPVRRYHYAVHYPMLANRYLVGGGGGGGSSSTTAPGATGSTLTTPTTAKPSTPGSTAATPTTRPTS